MQSIVKIAMICLILMIGHTLRRAYESYILATDSPAKFHIFAYIVGMTYYIGDIATLTAYTPAFIKYFPLNTYFYYK